MFLGLQTPAHISLDTYSRLLIPWQAPSLDKALYIDSDVAVREDIMNLWHVDVSNVYAGAVRDHGTGVIADGGQYGAIFPKNICYFNAGIMLLNLKKIRDDFTQELLMDIASKNKDIMRFCDQDVLNIAFSGNIRYLPPEWNVMWSFFSRDVPAMFLDAIVRARKNPAIVHFAGADKPWKIPGGLCASPYACEYFHYLRKTPFAGREREIFRASPCWRRSLRYWWRHPIFFIKPHFWNIRSVRRSLREKTFRQGKIEGGVG